MVPDRGPRGHRRVVAATLGYLTSTWRGIAAFAAFVLLLTILWVALKPGEPDLPRYQGFERQEAGYRPGGSGCDPSRLVRLTIPGREAADERDCCAEAAEEYRLQANDLIQQTRSADAAKAIIGLTYDQSRMAHVGLILGGSTMIAAIAAAIYARQAASETRRGANAAVDAANAAAAANALSDKVFLADQRPWVSIKVEIAGPLKWTDRGFYFPLRFKLKNTGKVPALNVRVRPKLMMKYHTSTLVAQQAEHADAMAADPRKAGINLFPDDEDETEITMQAEQPEFDQALAWINATSFHLVKGERRAVSRDALRPAVVGCVEYWSPTSRSRHQTGFIQIVWDQRILDSKGGAMNRERGDIPVEDLKLWRWLEDGRTD